MTTTLNTKTVARLRRQYRTLTPEGRIDTRRLQETDPAMYTPEAIAALNAEINRDIVLADARKVGARNNIPADQLGEFAEFAADSPLNTWKQILDAWHTHTMETTYRPAAPGEHPTTIEVDVLNNHIYPSTASPSRDFLNGNGAPGAVYHGLVLRFHPGCINYRLTNRLMQHLLPLVDRLHRGAEKRFNEQANPYLHLDDGAKQARAQIADLFDRLDQAERGAEFAISLGRDDMTARQYEQACEKAVRKARRDFITSLPIPANAKKKALK